MAAKRNVWAVRILLLIILVAGGSLRFYYNSYTLVDTPIRADAANYLFYAQNIINYSTFSKDRANTPPVPDAYWSPGYPVFLSSILAVSKSWGADAYISILNTQVLLGIGMIMLTYLLAAAFLPTFWPLLPAALVALSPHMVSMGIYLLTETLTGFTLLLSLYLFVAGTNKGSSFLCCMAGLFLAITYLVNPVTFFIGPIMAVAAIIYFGYRQPDQLKRGLKIGLLTLAPLILAASAWSLRSTLNVPEGSPDSSGRLLVNLNIGMHDDYHEVWRANPRDPNNPATLSMAIIGDSYGTFLRLLAQKVADDPLGMISWYAVRKPLMLWDWEILTGMGDIYVYPVLYSLYHTSKLALLTYTLMKSMHFWLLGFAILSAGYIFRAKGREGWITGLTYVIIVYVSGIYVISQAEARYSIPLRPEMYLLATYFIRQTVELYKNTRAIKPEGN